MKSVEIVVSTLVSQRNPPAEVLEKLDAADIKLEARGYRHRKMVGLLIVLVAVVLAGVALIVRH